MEELNNAAMMIHRHFSPSTPYIDRLKLVFFKVYFQVIVEVWGRTADYTVYRQTVDEKLFWIFRDFPQCIFGGLSLRAGRMAKRYAHSPRVHLTHIIVDIIKMVKKNSR